jgi:hypothetical protein
MYVVGLGGAPWLLPYLTPSGSVAEGYILTGFFALLIIGFMLASMPSFRLNSTDRQAELLHVAATLAASTDPSDAPKSPSRSFLGRQIRHWPLQVILVVSTFTGLAIFLHSALWHGQSDWATDIYISTMLSLLAFALLGLGHATRGSVREQELFSLYVTLLRDNDQLETLESTATLAIMALRNNPSQIITIQIRRGQTICIGETAKQIKDEAWATAQRGQALLSA